MAEVVYRISTSQELHTYQQTGFLPGGDLDRSSGFIHLSKASQVPIVLQKFMPGRSGLYLLAIDTAKLGNGLKFEKVEGLTESEGDYLFPHFYGPSGGYSPMPLEALLSVHELELEDGQHVLPFPSSS